MAAYTAVLSLMHTIKNLQNHPQPPISLHPKHLLSLTQTLAFLQHFLECYSNEDDDLERRITGAAHSAEDVIETHIVQLITENISSADFYRDLERAIQDLDLIKIEAMKISEAKNKGSQRHRTNSSLTPAAYTWQSSGAMVEFDHDLVIEVLERLVGQQSSLQIIPIVGMGGIGKTTFARNVYSKQLIVNHFDILVWVVISLECSGPKILLQVLSQENKEDDYELDKLGLRVHQWLWNRRYLIVMDDIWSSEPWDEIKSFFPDNNNGSRIMITTRNSHLAFELSGSHGFRMNFLDEDKSWDLLCWIVFGKESNCPVELDETGKAIAKKCRGLPLSVVVIGGVLRKSNMTLEYWEYTLDNMNSLINLEEDEYCYQLLHTSYKELPAHLKPCFLYMGVFLEDQEIVVSDVIKMWVAEGIVKPILIGEKSLEEAAEEYLRELIYRNLIMEGELRWNGTVKSCRIHDVLRDVCIREAQKQRFYCIVKEEDEISEGINMERRICINRFIRRKEYHPIAASAARSLFLVYNEDDTITSRVLRFRYQFRLGFGGPNSDAVIFEDINMRCISLHVGIFHLPLLWNIQTLAIQKPGKSPILEIWKMPLLRHAKLGGGVTLTDPVGQGRFVLEHLHTLSGVMNFKCDEEAITRIPNIKKLKLVYKYGVNEWPVQINLCLNNLHKLHTLAIDVLSFISTVNVSVAFPQSLQKLTLRGRGHNVEEMTTKIASLPLLQFLKIGSGSFTGCRWEIDEAQFCSLKHLHIEYWRDLKYWVADDTTFPCLQHLRLRALQELEEIPSSIGELPNLESIRVEYCSLSVQESAKRIKEEQEENGNEHLELIITNKM